MLLVAFAIVIATGPAVVDEDGRGLLLTREVRPSEPQL